MIKQVLFALLSPMINAYYMLSTKRLAIHWGARVYPGSRFEGSNKIWRKAYFRGEIGFASYIGPGSTIIGKVGRYCSIGGDVVCLVDTHPVETFVSSHPAFYSLKKQAGFTYAPSQLFDESPKLSGSKYSIEIGSDVYIGFGVKLIGPLRIGHGSVIAANSTVTKDVLPYTIVGGSPAKVIRQRFSPEQIAILTDFQWWTRDTAWLKENVDYFQDIQNFCTHILESYGDQGGTKNT